ncbi:MAG: GNAT family N-acetyltransferase [Chloroflexota bacterium]
MVVVIRDATQTDIPALDTLFGQIEVFHRVREGDFFVEPTPEARFALVAQWVEADDRKILVADDDEAGVVGMLHGFVRHIGGVSVVRERDVMVIDTIVVDENHGRRGIGSQLMTAAHEWGKTQNIHEFQLGVWAFNAGAIALYEKLGYRTYQYRMVLNTDADT